VTNLNPWNIKVQINELLVELGKTEIGLGPRVRISGATHGKSTKSVIIPTKPRKNEKKRHKLPPGPRQYSTHPPPVYHAN
jgi:hypothetical protein